MTETIIKEKFKFNGRVYELASRHSKNVMIRREVLDWQNVGYRTKIVVTKKEQLLYISGD